MRIIVLSDVCSSVQKQLIVIFLRAFGVFWNTTLIWWKSSFLGPNISITGKSVCHSQYGTCFLICVEKTFFAYADMISTLNYYEIFIKSSSFVQTDEGVLPSLFWGVCLSIRGKVNWPLCIEIKEKYDLVAGKEEVHDCFYIDTCGLLLLFPLTLPWKHFK